MTEEKISRVLILYTGGTIGMKITPRGYAPVKGFLQKQLYSMPQFHDPTQTDLTTPLSNLGQRIRYEIKEYDPLLDSVNMEFQDWTKIATDIEQEYNNYDAFIVLHGTDTMAYATSALSFMLINLSKPVIVTGSQLPLGEIRNDATENLLGALAIAGSFSIPEVCLFFRSKLFRGNRVRKIDASSFEAFSSGNFAPLATVGVDVSVQWSLVRLASKNDLKVVPIVETNVAALRIFPGMPVALLENVLKPPIKGVVLETFGAGNAPDNRPDFLAVLRKATERGVIIVNCTQCLRGRVKSQYASGQSLSEVGVVSGHDLTPESALMKLAYLLSYEELTIEDVKRVMQTSIRGELTEEESPSMSFRERAFVSSVAQILASSKDLNAVEQALYPVLMCAAAANDDVDALIRMVEGGADVNAKDYEGRTPLHVAAMSDASLSAAYLLTHGAQYDLMDKAGKTPLDEALRMESHQVLALLREED